MPLLADNFADRVVVNPLCAIMGGWRVLPPMDRQGLDFQTAKGGNVLHVKNKLRPNPQSTACSQTWETCDLEHARVTGRRPKIEGKGPRIEDVADQSSSQFMHGQRAAGLDVCLLNGSGSEG